jgi:hypothetical protein
VSGFDCGEAMFVDIRCIETTAPVRVPERKEKWMSPRRRRSSLSRFEKSWVILLWLVAILIGLAVAGLVFRNKLLSLQANRMQRVMTSLERVPTSTYDFLFARAQQWATPQQEAEACCALHLLSAKLDEVDASTGADSVGSPSQAGLPWRLMLQLANASVEIQFQFALHLRFTCIGSGESAWSVIEERIDMEQGLEPFASVDFCKWLDPKQVVDSQGRQLELRQGLLTEASLDGRNWVRVRSHGDEQSNEENSKQQAHVGRRLAVQ